MTLLWTLWCKFVYYVFDFQLFNLYYGKDEQ